FENLIDKIDEELSHRIFRIGVGVPQSEIPLNIARENVDKSDNIGLTDPINQSTNKPITKLSRNDPCWCGSGKKWKKCHYPKIA
ncbi:MAG TPA: SEC-C metal-binding domain-containing protein, partial [Alphaproteobacteria bacterium]|nr:SEC-C metal-binding domain-containing protein [Alphaproteobacteria bacterium]